MCVMAAKLEDDVSLQERERFSGCFSRLSNFVPSDNEASKTNFNLLLDEINSLDYYSKIVKAEEANRLISKLCHLVPLLEERLVVKFCQLVFNFTAKQQLELSDRPLIQITQFLISALHRCAAWTNADILQAFGAVIYENCGRLWQFHETLVSTLVPMALRDDQDEAVLRGAVQCIENLTLRSSNLPYLSEEHITLCLDAFLQLLHRVPQSNLDVLFQCKILICCLRGLQNLISGSKAVPPDKLGHILAVLRTYMFFGMSQSPFVIPETLYPSSVGQVEQKPAPPTSKPSDPRPGDSKPSPANKGKKKKKGKKTQKESQESQECGDTDTTEVAMATPADSTVYPAWAKINSSESDYSDTEGGQGSKLRSQTTKVRQCALLGLLTVIKVTERRVMFGFWSSFIPDSQAASNNTQTLLSIILKDTSPKCRMGALLVLTSLLDGSKSYLAVAADDRDEKNLAFVSLSSVLSSTIKEIHRCLLTALVAEHYPLTLTQLIKCLATLISNVPYQRLKPGLLSRVVKQVRNFLHHRDPNVRVACLTCFGAVVSIQPALMEICHIIHPSKPPSLPGKPPATSLETPMSQMSLATGQSSPMAASSSAASSVMNGHMSGGSPGMVTPPGGGGEASGTITPVFSDQVLQAHARETSWLLKLCIKNIQPHADLGDSQEMRFEPLPVRLESLQVLASLVKGYFSIVRNSLALLRELSIKCLQDPDQVIRLHASKLLDELTQVLLQDVQAKDSVNRISVEQSQEFWVTMVTGPVATILQHETYNAVKATTCDCVSNIGPDVFAAFSMDKRVLCITLVLGLTSDEDRVVRSAAVRAVGIYVLYPCLREDVSFIADAANAILKCMDDSSINVRVKTTWSLANLCDALVLNKIDGDTMFMEDFSDMLLQKLFTVAIKSCQDNDKVRSNAVRALGNLLHYLPIRSLDKCTFRIPVDDGIQALVKNISTGTVKVRWNACYAVSNMFKNSLLNSTNTSCFQDILSALCSVVKDCKNFKVRINAALALGSPSDRQQYGPPSMLSSVIESLLIGLETAELITDFAEYRYRDNLTNQICCTLLHLIALLTEADIDPVLPVIEGHMKTFEEGLAGYVSALSEQDTGFVEFTKASQRVTDLSRAKLTHPQCRLIQTLFLLVTKQDNEQKTEKTAFLQTYD